MTARSPSAFALSALLHASMAAVVLLGIYYSQQQASKRPVIFELVAGEGNNYMATEAPALGSPDGPPKLAIPQTAASPAPVTPKVVEVEAASTPPATIQVPDFAKKLKRADARALKKVEAQIKAEQEAEKKRLSKEEFDRLHGKSATPKTASASTHAVNVPRIDAQGIAKGVVGGSTANKTGGAGGKALQREEQSLVDSYLAFLSQQLHTAFDEAKPPGLSDRLEAIVELHVLADGTLADARIIRSSGSDEFDHAVLEAIARVRPLGTRPDGLDEVLKIPFRMLEDGTNG
ncbi:MAG TPA: TonB family protein [Opitutaceae bacterium]|jgi:colicin import membrane protein|nr:TonB family protein [Opitutaceae bacterium]